jgi:hypothetical protein
MLEDVLRDEPSLSGDAIVVRGGELRCNPVMRSFEQCWQLNGFWGLTVWHDPDLSVFELWDGVRQLSGYGSVRTARVAELDRNGFQVLPTFGERHYSIVTDGAPDLRICQLLDDSFNQALRR